MKNHNIKQTFFKSLLLGALIVSITACAPFRGWWLPFFGPAEPHHHHHSMQHESTQVIDDVQG